MANTPHAHLNSLGGAEREKEKEKEKNKEAGFATVEDAVDSVSQAVSHAVSHNSTGFSSHGYEGDVSPESLSQPVSPRSAIHFPFALFLLTCHIHSMTPLDPDMIERCSVEKMKPKRMEPQPPGLIGLIEASGKSQTLLRPVSAMSTQDNDGINRRLDQVKHLREPSMNACD